MNENLSKQNLEILLAKEEKFLNWDEVLKKFKSSFGNDVYESWIKNINLEINNETYNLSINNFTCNWMRS